MRGRRFGCTAGCSRARLRGGCRCCKYISFSCLLFPVFSSLCEKGKLSPSQPSGWSECFADINPHIEGLEWPCNRSEVLMLSSLVMVHVVGGMA